MRASKFLVVTVLALVAAPFAAASAASSCSSFAIITGYDEAASTITVSAEKGTESKFFPKPEGTPTTSKIPPKCKSKVLNQKGGFPVTATGGKLSVTQVRQNFSNKMLNDTDDKTWLPKKLKELVEGKTMVLVVARPPLRDKKGAYGVTTIYLPATQEDLDEIARLDAQAQDE
jgi:hypothetical protein